MAFSLSYHDINEFGEKKGRRRPSRILVDGSKPIYVPYFPAKPNPPKNVVDLIDSKQRVYVPSIILKGEEFFHHTYQDDFQKQIEEVHDTGKVLLDLGTEPLRRVVHEMKRLSNNEIIAKHDPLAAQHAGLISYCKYIQGNKKDLIKERREKRASAMAKKQAEMVIQGTLSVRRMNSLKNPYK